MWSKKCQRSYLIWSLPDKFIKASQLKLSYYGRHYKDLATRKGLKKGAYFRQRKQCFCSAKMIISERIDLKRGATISDLKINSPCTELIFPFAAQTQRKPHWQMNLSSKLKHAEHLSLTLIFYTRESFHLQNLFIFSRRRWSEFVNFTIWNFK